MSDVLIVGGALGCPVCGEPTHGLCPNRACAEALKMLLVQAYPQTFGIFGTPKRQCARPAQHAPDCECATLTGVKGAK